MSNQARLIDSPFVKIVFGAVLAFAGVAGGIYVGFALTGQNVPFVDPPEVNEAEAPWVAQEVGDIFPLENYRDATGGEHNFEQLLKREDAPSVLMFVSLGCDPCTNLLRHWNGRVAETVRPGLKTVICLGSDEPVIPAEYEDLLADKEVIWFDRDLFKDKYHFTFYPTVFAVDRFGFIQHIQFGFGRSGFDKEILEFTLKTGQ